MSARTPFEPLASRPPSRPVSSTGDKDGPPASPMPGTPTPGSLGSRNPNITSSTKLNLSGLITGKKTASSNGTSVYTSSKDASENAAHENDDVSSQLPSSTNNKKSHHRGKFAGLIAPKPQRSPLMSRVDSPLLTSVQSNNTISNLEDSSNNSLPAASEFKAPNIPYHFLGDSSFDPSNALDQTQDTNSSNNAHISSFSEQQPLKMPKAGPPVRFPLLSRRPPGRSSLEMISETEDEYAHQDVHAHLHQNVHQQMDDELGFQHRNDEAHLVNGHRRLKRKSDTRRRSKSTETGEGNSDDGHEYAEMEYGERAKRVKAQAEEQEYMQGLTMAMPFPSNQLVPSNYQQRQVPASSTFRPAFGQQSHINGINGIEPPSSPPREYAAHQAIVNNNATGSALSKVFGPEVDIYIAQSGEMYEKERQKWNECTMEEWISGASEMADLFAKALDYTKEYLTNKMAVFAQLNSHIDGHEKELEDRSNELYQAKDSLMSEGNGVTQFLV